MTKPHMPEACAFSGIHTRIEGIVCLRMQHVTVQAVHASMFSSPQQLTPIDPIDDHPVALLGSRCTAISNHVPQAQIQMFPEHRFKCSPSTDSNVPRAQIQMFPEHRFKDNVGAHRAPSSGVHCGNKCCARGFVDTKVFG
jgi:hypothetical protein